MDYPFGTGANADEDTPMMFHTSVNTAARYTNNNNVRTLNALDGVLTYLRPLRSQAPVV